ncbi:MAG: hypothetical protein ACE5IR_17395, partial [bacterium]
MNKGKRHALLEVRGMFDSQFFSLKSSVRKFMPELVLKNLIWLVLMKRKYLQLGLIVAFCYPAPVSLCEKANGYSNSSENSSVQQSREPIQIGNKSFIQNSNESGGCLETTKATQFQSNSSLFRRFSLDDTVQALAIYVAFPDQQSQNLPKYYKEVEFLMHDFFSDMSNGRHQLYVKTARRTPPYQNLAYVADSTLAFYNTAPASVNREGLLVEDIFKKIHHDHPTIFDGVDVVFFNILADFIQGATAVANLVRPREAFKIYRGLGTTQDVTGEHVFKGILAHEYAHLLGFRHPPDHFQVEYGDYALMDRLVGRLVPLSIEHLWRNGWLDSSKVIRLGGEHKNVVIGDIRRGGKAYQLPISKNEYFWLVNHQGSDYDSTYFGKGLLIWHISSFSFLITRQTSQIDIWPKNKTINMHPDDNRSTQIWIGNRGQKDLNYSISSSEILEHKRKTGFAGFLPPRDTLITKEKLHVPSSQVAPVLDGL